MLSYVNELGFRGLSSSLPMAKFDIISLTTKKNFKKYLISLIIKHLQRGIFAVKRFNRPCYWVWGGLGRSGGSGYQCTHPRARVCTYARRHGRNLLKRFVFSSRHPVGIFVSRRIQDAKIKRFNNTAQADLNMLHNLYYVKLYVMY